MEMQLSPLQHFCIAARIFEHLGLWCFVKTRLKCVPNQGKTAYLYHNQNVLVILYHKCSFISLFLIVLCNFCVRIVLMVLRTFTLNSTANSVA